MENYGIRSEGEIMSGCIVEMRNRISDKDQDDMSFYNTNQMIETKMTSLVCKFRETFFEVQFISIFIYFLISMPLSGIWWIHSKMYTFTKCLR